MSQHILCLDDNEGFLFGLSMALKGKYQVSTASTFERAESILRNDAVDLVLLDFDLGDMDGIKALRQIKNIDQNLAVIMLSGRKDTSVIVRAMHAGANDYLCKPYPTEELILVIDKNLANKQAADRSSALVEHFNQSSQECKFIGRSPAVLQLLEKAQKLRGFDASILIEGESGTGKEVLAKYIYSIEGDRKRPFIAVNCAAIPENLLESELFGHEKGAFTGAIKRKIGKFELASGGDIFLDEINSLRPDMQAKLLRVLQEKEFYRVGGDVSVKINVRVIAATNSALEDMVLNGQFRQDLYYRLRVISFTIPALRQRMEDLEDLVEYFMKKLSGGTKSLSPEACRVLRAYPWPGNIRELRNLLESLVIMCGKSVIEASDLPGWVRGAYMDGEDSLARYTKGMQLKASQVSEALKDYVRKKEIEYIRRAIEVHNGNVSRTAEILKVSRSTIYNALNRASH